MRLGFGEELSSGHESFDERIFIAGDHPQIAETLGQSAELRELITVLVPEVLSSISITGKTLRFQLRPDVDHRAVLPKLARMQELLSGVSHGVRSRFADPFYVKALVVESLVWGIVGYTVVAIVDMRAVRGDYHLFRGDLIWNGVIFGVFLLSVALVFLLAVLGRSSRTPRIMLESGVLLLLAMPFAGIQLLSDGNRGLDQRPGVVIQRPVLRTERQAHRDRRYYTYHAHFAPQAVEPPYGGGSLVLPTEMALTAAVYGKVERTRVLVIEVAPGFLGMPWYRRVE